MTEFGWPALYVLLVWWFSTGAVLYVIGLPRRMVPAMMLAATALAAVAVYALVTTSADVSPAGAYAAFTAALVIWGWHEMSFLTGLVTGPRTTPLEENAEGLGRLVPAIGTLIYHEIAIFLTLAAILALTWGAPNMTGFATFAVLWVMRLSAKLNVFLGVPNLTEEFLPEHLVYLKTYFRRRPMNALFPLSITLSTIVATLLVLATGQATSDGEAAGLALVATLLILAIVEHWFLVLPIPAASLWTWGLASRELPAAERTGHETIKHDRLSNLPHEAAVIGLEK